MIAVIGGTGLNALTDKAEVVGSRETPYGQTSADLLQTVSGGKKLIFLARHGQPHVIAPHKINYRANLWALQAVGVKSVIAVNAVGGIAVHLPAGTLCLPDQIIDYTYGREQTFYEGGDLGLEHIDFSYPFSSHLRKVLIDAAKQIAMPLVSSGVYAVTQGPRLETAAEINRLEKDGCDMVGMTAMPEAALARELAIDYVSVCLVVNPAAGRSDQLITMADIHRVVDTGMEKVRALLAEAVLHI